MVAEDRIRCTSEGGGIRLKIEMGSTELRKIIKGALRATKNDHGEIVVGSAIKRIMGQIEGAQKRKNYDKAVLNRVTLEKGLERRLQDLYSARRDSQDHYEIKQIDWHIDKITKLLETG